MNAAPTNARILVQKLYLIANCLRSSDAIFEANKQKAKNKREKNWKEHNIEIGLFQFTAIK